MRFAAIGFARPSLARPSIVLSAICLANSPSHCLACDSTRCKRANARLNSIISQIEANAARSRAPLAVGAGEVVLALVRIGRASAIIQLRAAARTAEQSQKQDDFPCFQWPAFVLSDFLHPFPHRFFSKRSRISSKIFQSDGLVFTFCFPYRIGADGADGKTSLFCIGLQKH